MLYHEGSFREYREFMASRRTKKTPAVDKAAPQPKPEAILPSPAPVAESGAITRVLHPADLWLTARVEWLVWLIVLIGFYLRLDYATGTYLNGDEMLIMYVVVQRGLADVYRAGLTMPYGPLVYYLLHFMSFFGTSEVYLRLPSILAGALAPYAAYRWVSYTFGKAEGLVTACILGFSPALVILGAQARFYTIHMLWMLCSLYCLERAFRERSVKWIRLFGAALLLALLTMYMSVWYVAAIGLYALVRIAQEKLPFRMVWEWLGIQAVLGAIALVAYLTQLRYLRGDELELFARDGWLRRSYFHADSGSALDFLTRTTDALFGYVFSNATLGTWMVFVFLAGAGLLLWRGATAAPRTVALALFLPLAATCAAALLQLYPYGGSRHDAFLAVFIAAGVGVACSFAVQTKVLPLVLAALWLVPQWRAAAQHDNLDEFPQASRVEQLRDALDYLATRTPRPQVLVMDQHGSEMAKYYLCHGAISGLQELPHDLRTYSCAGYRILTAHTRTQSLDFYPGILAQARQSGMDSFPGPAWALSMGGGSQATVTVREDDRGIFGRIRIYRLSPQ